MRHQRNTPGLLNRDTAWAFGAVEVVFDDVVEGMHMHFRCAVLSNPLHGQADTRCLPSIWRRVRCSARITSITLYMEWFLASRPLTSR